MLRLSRHQRDRGLFGFGRFGCGVPVGTSRRPRFSEKERFWPIWGNKLSWEVPFLPQLGALALIRPHNPK